MWENSELPHALACFGVGCRSMGKLGVAHIGTVKAVVRMRVSPNSVHGEVLSGRIASAIAPFIKNATTSPNRKTALNWGCEISPFARAATPAGE